MIINYDIDSFNKKIHSCIILINKGTKRFLLNIYILKINKINNFQLKFYSNYLHPSKFLKSRC
jgi:hypothetical protein